MMAAPVYPTVESPTSAATHWPALVSGLTDALSSERRLIEELVSAMHQQREAVAADDLAAIDDSVFAVQRILLTLGEARKRRRTLNTRLGQPESLALRDLIERLGPHATDALRTARDDLQAAAQRLAREVATNRQILREALTTGEAMVRTLAGVPETKVGYGHQSASPGSGAWLVNKRA